jgi:microcin C transport system substrate-binding protein
MIAAMVRALILAVGLIVATIGGAAAIGHSSHGISVFGDLKYGPDFTSFDYVDANAPKGGALRLWGLDSFDNLNPFILKGVPPQGISLIFDTLMVRAMDEPDALYGLVARSVTLAADGGAVTFALRPEARFHDGSPITADDVVFTFETLIKKGHPQYRFLFRDVARAEAIGGDKVRFIFRPGGEFRDLPTRLAGLPVLSRRYFTATPFDKTTLTPPLGSGPYKVGKLEPGRSIVYERVRDYWARDLPVNRGRFNFDTLRWDYYRDREIAFAAVFSGAYDFREEFTSRSWATQYDKPPVRQGLMVRETLPDETPSGVQGWFLNLRRDKFKDRRVRAALDLAFDFEWTNKNLFYGLYQRTNSMYENSTLAARAAPDKAELALLAPFRGKVPDEVFTTPYRSPVSDGTGRIRGNLRKATRLLKAAGYTIRDGVLVDPAGQKMRIEFLLFESSFQRIIGPYIRNLKRLGIDAFMRIVDVANYTLRRQNFDFDVVVNRYVQPLTPGVEQRDYFGSAAADIAGSRNLAGIKDPVVDALVARVMAAGDRKALTTAVRALDRVLMWNRYWIPQWYKGVHTIAYWNKFGRPRTKPKYDLGVIDTWWYDAAKAAMIAAGKAPAKP